MLTVYSHITRSNSCGLQTVETCNVFCKTNIQGIIIFSYNTNVSSVNSFGRSSDNIKLLIQLSRYDFAII